MPQLRDEDFDWREKVGAQPLRLRPRNAVWASLAGYGASQVVGLGAVKLGGLIFQLFPAVRNGWWGSLVGFFVWSQFLLIPSGMGLVAAYFWIDEREAQREVNDRPLDANGSVLLNTILLGIGAFFLAPEIEDFIILGSPLVCFLMWIGTRTGNRLWNNNPFLNT